MAGPQPGMFGKTAVEQNIPWFAKHQKIENITLENAYLLFENPLGQDLSNRTAWCCFKDVFFSNAVFKMQIFLSILR